MANPLKGEASFTHDGKELTLAITAAALLEVEDETGIGLFEMMGQGMGKLAVLAALLRHGLVAGGGPMLSRSEAADMLLRNTRAGDAIRVALVRALPDDPEPDEEGDDANPPKAAKRGTGKKS